MEMDKLTRNEQVGLVRAAGKTGSIALWAQSKERQANVRFIVATNRDLRKLVDEGRISAGGPLSSHETCCPSICRR
jgi:DNA-binding NtrC family response regulator